jgi:uncharacterized protein YecE (DUF72 family)
MATIRIGIAGWTYAGWRGGFYPKGLSPKNELAYAADKLGSIEINGTFYSLQRPSSFARWRETTPEDFVFAIKGGRFITHMKRLVDVDIALANFFAAGPLALGPKLGPFLWQLPPSLPYDRIRLEQFIMRLPRTTVAAAALACNHDDRLKHGTFTTVDSDQPLRHAFEVRHKSYAVPEFVELLREHQIGLVVADTAGTWPVMEDITADFLYVRLHGSAELYASGYTEKALDKWAGKISSWAAGGSAESTEHTVSEPAPRSTTGRDVFVYFDNDVKGYAPFDALALMARLNTPGPS